ncbi:MAG: serine acetyltransferase, partial [Ruminococcus sp.]|nr:serine acetyltransferase [Ruminococcus sp.]
MDNGMENRIDKLVDLLMDDYSKGRVIDENKMFEYPDKDTVIDILEKLKVVIYPGYYPNSNYRTYTVRNNISILLEDIIYNLQKQTAIVLRYTPRFENSSAEEIAAEAERVTFAFL